MGSSPRAALAPLVERRAETFVLSVLPTRVGIARKAVLTVASGEGVAWPAEVPTDEAFRASVANAWRAATRLAGMDGLGVRLDVPGRAPLAGPSAGFPLGLAMLGALLDAALPKDVLATGAVLDEDGWLGGGLELAAKAQAAAGLGCATLLAPPVPEASHHGVRIAPCADLASAFALVAPDAYASLRSRHDALRRREGRGEALHVAGPSKLPAEVEGVPVVHALSDGLLRAERVVDGVARARAFLGSPADLPGFLHVARATFSA